MTDSPFSDAILAIDRGQIDDLTGLLVDFR